MVASTKSNVSRGKRSKSTLSAQQYKRMINQHEPARSVIKNCSCAFIVGGGICVFGQVIQQLYMTYMQLSEEQASGPTIVTLILGSVILTSCGVYDKISQWAGAGTAVPVTGFANSMCSAALEHRSEGLVLGVGGNMFKLAGSVMVFGIFAAFVIALFYLIFGLQH